MRRLFTVLVIIFITLSCNFFKNKKVTLKVINNSNIKYDSIKLYLYLNYDTTFYNVKPKFNFLKKVELKNTEYDESGTKITSSLIVFKDSTFYYTSGGFIDYPYGEMESEYSYYIFDDYITTKKDFKPQYMPKKHKLSEYKDSEN